MSTLQRAVWDGHPVSLGIGFELRKPERALASCAQSAVWRAIFLGGNCFWNGRTAVSFARLRSSDEVLDLCEHWRAVMVGSGWRGPA